MRPRFAFVPKFDFLKRCRPHFQKSFASSSNQPPTKLSVSTLDILKLPQYKFDGRVILLNSQEEEERISGIFDNIDVLGFDTEAQPQSSCSIARNATSLVQIASKDVAVIWRLGKSAKTDGSGWHRQVLPPYLKKLVNDGDVVKVSQGAVHEVIGLQQEFGERAPRGFVDLHSIAQSLQCYPRSLQGLVDIFMRKRLDKEQRLSNWGKDGPLSEQQINYAACDAHASLAVLLAMRESFGVKKLGCEIVINPGTLWPGPSISQLKKSEETNSTKPDESKSIGSQSGENISEVKTSKTIFAQNSKTNSAKNNSKSQANDLSTLTDFCVENGLQLQFGGFESCRGGFRSVFKVALQDHSTKYFKSDEVHTSIRAAQNCAARVALRELQNGSAHVANLQ